MPRFPRILASKTYQNTGSTARDHLASERTFLAWQRTGLGFIALGIAVERFSQLQDMQSPVPVSSATTSAANSTSTATTSAPREAEQQAHAKVTKKRDETVLIGALLASGAGSIVYGASRYFTNLRALEQGLYKPAYRGAAALAVGVAGVAGWAGVVGWK